MNDFSAEWSWSQRAADYAPRTIKDHTGFASAFVTWLDHEGVALDRATRGDAERWLVSLVSVHQRRKAVYALKAFARWCAEENISDDFGMRLRAPKCPSPPQKVASGEEVEALLAACRGRGFEVARDAALIATFASTGMRRSEMERVEVEHLDLDAGTILLPTSKNKRGRLAFLDADARRRLGRYLRYRSGYPHADDPHLWVGRKGPLSADGMRQVLEKRGRLAGVRVPLHAFRRGFAHRWLRSGGSVPGLMAAAGSQDHAMPVRYVRSVAADLAREEHARIFTEPARASGSFPRDVEPFEPGWLRAPSPTKYRIERLPQQVLDGSRNNRAATIEPRHAHAAGNPPPASLIGDRSPVAYESC